MGDLKAFVVTASDIDASVLVFAENLTEAKKIGFSNEWFEDCNWIDLRCRRESSADDFANKYGKCALSADTREQQRLLRDLGWYEIDQESRCEWCDSAQWHLVPESTLSIINRHDDDEALICEECLAGEFLRVMG